MRERSKSIKKRSIEEIISLLKEYRESELFLGLSKECIKYLKHKNNVVIAEAAKVVREHQLKECIPQLIQSFEKCMINPVRTDPVCIAKKTIISTLRDLDYNEPEIYCKGIKHIQLEPSYGPPIDSAVELRSTCALALVQTGYSDIFYELTAALCDPEANVRQNAARALGALGGERAELLLRFRILIGDQAKENYLEYFKALIESSPRNSIDFIAGYLNNQNPIISEDAAFALGESRCSEAFPILKDIANSKVNINDRKPFLLAIALLRIEEGFAYLFDALDDSSGESTNIILEILKLFKANPVVAEKISKYK
jgi:HEAT repeat protein